MKSSHDRSYPEHFRALDPERFWRYQSRWVCNTPASFTAAARMMLAVDLTPEYAKIKAPTLVIAGRFDPATTVEAGEYLKANIPGAKLAIVDAAHIANVEAPDAYTKTVLDFLASR